MVYIGAVKQLFTFPFFDAQANFFAKVLEKSIEIPNSEEMKAEFEASSEALKKLPTVVDIIKYQSDYIGGLNEESGSQSCDAARGARGAARRDTARRGGIVTLRCPNAPR